MMSWQERYGEPGHPGEPGIHGGGKGGQGGQGGHGGDVGDIEVNISSLTQRIISHESYCNSQKTIGMWILGLLITVILGIAAQLLIVTGKQEGLLIAVDSQTQRITQITANSNLKDEALHRDIIELRSLIIQHDRKK